MSFAHALRAARKAARLTQADAAKMCGVGKRTFEKWEAGVIAPPPEAGAITRERVLARLTPASNGWLGSPNVASVPRPLGAVGSDGLVRGPFGKSTEENKSEK